MAANGFQDQARARAGERYRWNGPGGWLSPEAFAAWQVGRHRSRWELAAAAACGLAAGLVLGAKVRHG